MEIINVPMPIDGCAMLQERVTKHTSVYLVQCLIFYFNLVSYIEFHSIFNQLTKMTEMDRKPYYLCLC